MSRKEGWKLNKQRRKQISEVVSRVESVQAELESLPDDIQGIMDEETEYRDNIPENMQGGDRYEMAGRVEHLRIALRHS